MTKVRENSIVRTPDGREVTLSTLMREGKIQFRHVPVFVSRPGSQPRQAWFADLKTTDGSQVGWEVPRSVYARHATGNKTAA